MDPSRSPMELYGQLIGYGLSSTLAVLLAALAWQSPDTGRQARALNAICGAVWSLAGLARFGLLAAGVSAQSSVQSWTGSLAFSAAAVWPVCLLLFWNTSVVPPGRRQAGRWLLGATGIAAVLLVSTLFVAPTYRPQWLTELHYLVGYNAIAWLCGGILILRPRIDTGVERVAVALVPLGPLLSLVAHWLQEGAILPSAWDPVLDLLTKQSIVLTMLGALIYLGRFQASDRFAKRGLRLVLAWTFGVVVTWIVLRPGDGGAMLRTGEDAIGAAVASAATAAVVLLSGWLATVSDRWVERRIFGRRDPQAALADLRERLALQDSEAAVLASTQRFVLDTLNIEVLVVPDGEPPGGPASCPVQVGDKEYFALVVGRSIRRGLPLSGEMELIRQAAQLAGRRLEALEREQERIELSKRQDRLMHQLVDAELRALRAQINPHFLFNSLNTIAALVHQDAAIAEAMILRLARIFRYVLTQTDRPFAPLHEEIAFLRAYLDIEQMRFGNRLHIEFRVPEAISDRPVPSLILQPLVENAIKHGFSPKLDECRLVIGCGTVGEQLVLTVEDNGIGMLPDAPRLEAAGGVGLRNVRERLATVYGGQAHLSFESRPRRGSRATLHLPLHFSKPVPT